jgi:hypothetical protein
MAVDIVTPFAAELAFRIKQWKFADYPRRCKPVIGLRKK